MKSLDLTYLQTFREVAARLSITRAAEEIGYAQSSVTTQIQKLEKHYQVKLFQRSGSGLRLTSAGEELHAVAGQMLELYQQSMEKLAEQGGGTLSISTMDTVAAYFLPPHLHAIRNRYPGLSIRLRTEREEEILSRTKEGHADLGLLLASEPSDPSLTWTVLRGEPLVLLSRPDHLLAQMERVELAHLSEQEWIMPEATCSYRLMLEKALRSQGISCRIALELSNPEAIKRMVMAGSGLCLLPRMAAVQEISSGELAVLPFSHPDIALDLQLVIHPRKWISRALETFLTQVAGKE